MNCLVIMMMVAACGVVESLPHKPRTECAGLTYDGSECIFALDKAYEFDAAEQACEARDAHLVYIASEAMYSAVAGQLRKQMADNDWELAVYWVGAHYDTKTKAVTFLNGQLSTWEHHWYPGFPLNFDATWTGVGMQIHSDPDHLLHGYLNHPESADLIPVCQAHLEV